MDELKLCAKCLTQRSPLELACSKCHERKAVTVSQALQLLYNSVMVLQQCVDGLTKAVGQQAIILKGLTTKHEKDTAGGLLLPPTARGMPRGG